ERWYRRWQHDDHGRPLSVGEVIRGILDGLSTFPGLRHVTGMWRIISKPFRQSGGRGALPQQIRDTSGGLIDSYVEAFAKELAETIMGERRGTANRSMERIEQRARDVWKQIAAGSPEIAAQEPDFPKMRDRLARAHTGDNGEPSDLTGWPYARPRYIMHDML